MNNEFISSMRVYIEDTDAGGIVYYVNYLKYMERARTELFRKLGYDKPALITDGLLLVVAASHVNYRKSARLDDWLDVSANIKKIAKTYIEFDQRVYKEGELLCDAEIKIACVSKNEMKPKRFPADVCQAFTTYFSTQGSLSS